MKLDQLKSDFDRCGISPVIHTTSFLEHKKTPKIQGLYSIWQGDKCVYVGQGGGTGGIRKRFKHHYDKAYALFETGTTDTVGWREGRETDWWHPESWTVEYFECTSAVHRTYLEGVMLLLFNPYCNDETYEDRQTVTNL